MSVNKVTKIIFIILSIYSVIAIILYGLFVYIDYKVLTPESVSFPNINQVTHIEVQVYQESEIPSKLYFYSIEDRKKIKAILLFLNKHDNKWSYYIATSPIYPYTASFKNDEEYLISIFLGLEKSLGVSGDIVTSISSQQEQELFQLLNIPE